MRSRLTFFAVGIGILLGTGQTARSSPGRTLSFAERVAYQYAIEGVYWRHRIWPKENSAPKPSLDEVMSRAEIEKKVEGYLRKSQALEDYWQRPITTDQLQAELERMASHTKESEVLRELFAALGNDPFVIAECLARQALAERLMADWYAHDRRIHRELRRRAEAELRTHRSLEQIKQTSGTYTEVEWVKSDGAETRLTPANIKSVASVKLNGSEWQESVEKLAAQFDSQNIVGQASCLREGGLATGARSLHFRNFSRPRQMDADAGTARPDPLNQIKTGVLSSLREDDAHYYAVAVTKKGKDRLKLATISWLKEPLRSWLAKAKLQVPVTMAAVNANYTLPTISNTPDTCPNDTWAPSSLNSPPGRYLHTAVWTGTEMIVWGGENYTFILDRGGRYNPSTDTWTTISTTNGPSPRRIHTAVWTGVEMIIWGGFDGSSDVNTGNRYNPSTDTWTAVSTTNAPSPREDHTAVWTGGEMIIWGGDNGSELNTGGKYNPTTNTWSTMSLTNAPVARAGHTAVWTGSEMIVWGGSNGIFSVLNTGSRYNPAANSWTATSTTNAPSAREAHTAVWTGSQMIVWGGDDGMFNPFNTGGRYNPATNSWTVTSITNAPVARVAHTAVWTDNQMIVWGGDDGNTTINTGARYNPVTNSWIGTSTSNAPHTRQGHTAVWTGTEMIIWGGRQDTGFSNNQFSATGGRYNPATDSWVDANAPTIRENNSVVWTGSEMIVWGGHLSPDDTFYYDTKTGSRYNPATESWTPTEIVNAPTEREGAIALWTGTEAIIWGGGNYFGALNTGARYDPGTNSWAAMSTTNAPRRANYAGVWSGSEMILWGGGDLEGHSSDTGARYNPTTNSWQAISTTNAPTAGAGFTAVWTGSEMIVWGGATGYCDPQAGCHDVTYFNTGEKYNPITDIWTGTSTTNAPSPRLSQTAVWTGSQMIVWGGGYLLDPQHTGQEFLRDGAKYDPAANTWRAINTINSPTIRGPAIWTGNEMIIWGGSSDSSPYFRNTGRRYNPAANVWLPTSTSGNVPVGRDGHTAVWTGTEMIIWGGYWSGDYLNNGGRYCAASTMLPSESNRYDFNGDGKPDYALLNAATHQTAIWYLNNNTNIGGGFGPTLPAGWVLAGVADFNGDGKPDYALFNASTHQTAIWYLNDRVRLGAAFGPTVPGGWQLAAVGDFNGDGKPDYVLYNVSTRQTVIWYLNNNVHVTSAYGPTLPAGWNIAGVADFNRDGHLDYLLFNASTQRTAIWYLNNNAYVSGAVGPTIASGYVLKGAADFDGDTKPDYVLYNPSTQRTAIWHLNNNVYVSGAFGPTLSTGWSLVAP